MFSSLAKLTDEMEFQQVLNQFISFSPSLVTVIGYILPVLELVLGVSIISGVFLKWAALLACGVLILFVATFLPLAGTSIKCGCFGGFISSESIGYGFFLRDLLLFGASLFIYDRSSKDQISGKQENHLSGEQ